MKILSGPQVYSLVQFYTEAAMCVEGEEIIEKDIRGKALKDDYSSNTV